MDSNNNPISNANPAMPSIPSSPAPEPVVPTPSDAMPTINPYIDNTPAPEPATSSVPTFSPANPAADAAPVIPTTSSTPTSFGMNSNNGSFDPSSVASFFTPETPSFANGGIIAATEPITEPDPIPEPDPIEQELNAPFKAAAPVPGSIGSAVSVPKDAPAPAETPAEAPAESPAPEVPANPVEAVSVEDNAPIVNPNNPFLAQNSTPAQSEPVAPVAEAAPVAESMVAADPTAMNASVDMNAGAMPMGDMQAFPAPEVPQFDPNNPLPMPGDMPMGDPMQPPVQDMPFAFDATNNQMNPFAEAASLNADPNSQIPGAPQKVDNKKKIIIIAAAVAAVLLIVIIAVVMMGGGSKKTTNTSSNTSSSTPTPTPTPTPEPEPTPSSTTGNTTCTRGFNEDEYSKYIGIESGSVSVTIGYKNDVITSMSLAEIAKFDSEDNRSLSQDLMQDDYNTSAILRYEIVDDSALNYNYVGNGINLTGTRTINDFESLDPGIAKMFNLVSDGSDYLAEDTIVKYENNGYTCKETGSSGSYDDDYELDDSEYYDEEEI